MPNLEKALQIAVKAHAGQTDKSGAAYIFHPIRVMARCRTDDAKIVALLHDVVEDTAVSFDDLAAEGFSDSIMSVLRLVTHLPDVPYDEYIRAVSTNHIATEVKLADLEDNADIRRLQDVDDRAAARLRKYLSAYRFLTSIRNDRNA